MKQILGHVLEVHEVLPQYYDAIKNFEGTITFDDGLYTQYLFLKDNPDVCKRSIVFITPKCIRNDLAKPYIECILCDTAHAMYVSGDNKAYMSLVEIAELKRLGVQIGYHSYSHLNISSAYSKASQKLDKLKLEVHCMLEYQKEYGIFDNIFCVPYNDYSILNLYLKLLEKKSNEEFWYVKDRYAVELRPEVPNDLRILYNRKMFSINRLPFYI